MDQKISHVACTFKTSAQMLQFSAFEPKVFNIPLMTVVYHMQSLTALGLIVICFSYLINQRQIVDIIYFLRQTLELDAYVQSASATVILKYITVVQGKSACAKQLSCSRDKVEKNTTSKTITRQSPSFQTLRLHKFLNTTFKAMF